MTERQYNNFMKRCKCWNVILHDLTLYAENIADFKERVQMLDAVNVIRNKFDDIMKYTRYEEIH